MIIRLSDCATLRPQQIIWFQKYFIEKKRFFLTAAHRRFGKGLCAFLLMVCAALLRRGIYGYFLPTIGQSRKVVWQAIGEDGTKLIQRIPSALVANINHSEQMITLINGSIIYISGSDNYERWVGLNFCYLVFDEAQDTDMHAWDAFRPMITRNKGFTHFLGTPRAYTKFKELYFEHYDNPDWFCTNLTIKDTVDQFGQPIITPEDIEGERRNGMPEELIQQEYFGSWDATIRGAYFSNSLLLAHKEERIGSFPAMSMLPVYTGWDLGYDDDTTIWFVQVSEGKVYLIDYYEDRQKGMAHYVAVIRKKANDNQWRMGANFVPHDANNKNPGTAKSPMMIARELGMPMRLVERPAKKIHGIHVVRHMFPRFHFNAQACKQGLKHLSEYRPQYDEHNDVYSLQPLRNSATHGADALQTFCLGWMRSFEEEGLRKQIDIANLYGSLVWA